MSYFTFSILPCVTSAGGGDGMVHEVPLWEMEGWLVTAQGT